MSIRHKEKIKQMKPELIVALDVASSDDIPGIVDALPEEIAYYKVGLELFTSEGPSAFNYLKKRNKKIFLDLKLHDIPRTVARAVAAAARHEIALLTVHAGGGRDMLTAASEAAKEQGKSAPKLIAVTTLTSLNDDDLRKLGVSRHLAEHTIALGEMAISAGINGLVCSVHEAPVFREKLGDSPILVTPGIRLRVPEDATAGHVRLRQKASPRQVRPGSEADDQKRSATPEMAVKAGSNFLVVGRPILEAADPRAAATEILQQMEMTSLD